MSMKEYIYEQDGNFLIIIIRDLEENMHFPFAFHFPQ